MEFIEKVNVQSVRWLLANLSNEFIQKIKSEEDDPVKYAYIKSILQSYSKNDGILKVVYRKTDEFQILRDYGRGIQALPKAFRGLIYKHSNDVDMVKCHPTILWNLCKKYNVTCLYLEDYVKNGTALIERNETSKKQIMTSMNYNKPIKGSHWMRSFDNEMKQIQQFFYKLPEFESQRLGSDAKPKNREGSFMSRLTTSYEVKILHFILSKLPFKVNALMFDGFMFEGDRPPHLLEDLTKMIKDEFQMDIQFIYKEHDNSLVVPSDWTDVNDPEIIYQILKPKYEVEYGLAFIECSAMYSYKINGKISFFSEADCARQFANVFVGTTNFFRKWLIDPERQTFHSVGVYPHDVICPDGCLNLWTGYDAEKLPESTANIEPILKHIRTLCKEQIVYDFLMNWFANMLQYPSSQSIMVILRSEEGAGKSLIVDFLTLIMGRHLCIEIQNAQDDLFGRFNGHLSGKVLLNINEAERKDLTPFIERLKTMITSPTITIEDKGQKKYVEDNKRHMLATVNPENPLPVKEGGRRFFYVEVSNELIGQTDYFTEMYNFIEKPENQRAFYQYLMARTVHKKLTVKDIPITEDMKSMYALNRDPVEEYCIEYAGERTSMENYLAYKQYMVDNGLKYEISKKSFEMKFTKYMEKYAIVKRRKDMVADGVREQIMVYVKICVVPKLEV